ncbi:MAG: ATP-binding protein [Erysipelotrichaceae bacterium]|nr:ATP-binding protein [Erysipelotrichaceae bacterium]
MLMIYRTEYMNLLKEWQNKNIIKVVTGIRRCGKSTLLEMFRNHLAENGVNTNQIISINFEALEVEELTNYKALYTYITERCIPDKTMYIFLDEIQHVANYEKVVDSLFIKGNIDIYITGSNSYIFSGQLATNLRGRYIEIPMLPLSFKEYHSLRNESETKSFRRYMETGGFPYLSQYDLSQNQIDMYLEGIYNTVLLKDIEERMNRKHEGIKEKNITDVALLKAISRYCSSTIGSPISLRGIANYFISNERRISPNTVSDYVEALCESYLYYAAEPMDISGKQLLKSNKKYYIVDLGLRNHILAKKKYDLGFSIENIVYFELLRRGYQVNIGKAGDLEIDFIAKKTGEYTYFQVTADLTAESTFQREVNPLEKINDNYEKIVLTLDQFSTGNYNGIKIINVIDWLLS